MIKKCADKGAFWHIIWLTVIYVAAHWFLLVATGKWIDDWVYADHNVEYIIEVFMQSSLPLEAFIKMSVWNLPYRWFVFLYFYLSGILVYAILNKVDLFSQEACFWIVALFMTIPINDARISWICYGYSLCFLLFWVSFYIVTIWMRAKGAKKIGLRVFSLLMLMLSFNLESTMLMTLFILFFLYYEDLKGEWKRGEIKANIKKFLIAIVRYADFLIAPIAWYVLDKVLFPAYGAYGGHSYIPWGKLPKIILHSPVYALKTLSTIIKSYFSVLDSDIVRILIVIILIVYVTIRFAFRKKGWENHNLSMLMLIAMLLLGIMTFYIGYFPYGVKRNSALNTLLVDGRDAMLLGIGTALLIYYFVQAFFHERITGLILVFTVVLGIVHFNFTYFIWQESYYQQLQFQDEIKENTEIQRNNTFLVVCKNAAIRPIFFQNNGNSWAVTGEETRLFISGVNELDLLYGLDESTWFLNAYGMKDYDFTDKKIDGIILIDYADIGRGTILKQKWNELFNENEFHDWIKDLKNIQYVSVSAEEDDIIREKYEEGELTDSLIFERYWDG